MKYSVDTYRLYSDERKYSFSIRTRVTMKEPVDAGILESAVHTAMTRYPYFAVKVTVDEDGGYVLKPNAAPVAVLPLGNEVRKLGTKELNGHLLFVEYQGKDIYFNISHSLCGGRGEQPWVMTCVYLYVKERYHVEPVAPEIRKPGEPLLIGEDTEPTMDMLLSAPPVYDSKSKNPHIMAMDYLHGVYNPLMRNPNYMIFAFRQKDIMRFAKANDASVASFFLVVVAKALDKVLPAKVKVIGGEIAHNPAGDIGLPNSHCDLLSHAWLDYDREMLQWDMEKLGTMTRGQIMLQTDPTVSSHQLREQFAFYEKLDQIAGLANKRAYRKKNSPSDDNGRHGTYIVNYTGRMDWGQVADYVESFVHIVEGHLLLEVTSIGNRIFVSFMRLLNDSKYTDAFMDVLNELDIPFRVKGPFPKHLSGHDVPLK